MGFELRCRLYSCFALWSRSAICSIGTGPRPSTFLAHSPSAAPQATARLNTKDVSVVRQPLRIAFNDKTENAGTRRLNAVGSRLSSRELVVGDACDYSSLFHSNGRDAATFDIWCGSNGTIEPVILAFWHVEPRLYGQSPLACTKVAARHHIVSDLCRQRHFRCQGIGCSHG